jgi:hypothetical protein
VNDASERAESGEDPYEIEWPDDAKELRAAEREEAAKRALVRPAPLLLSAVAIGITTVMVFILPISLLGGALGFWVAVAAPVTIAGLVLALPPALLLQRVSRTWRRGFPELAFVVLGVAIGAGWTWVFITLLASQLFSDPTQMPPVRVQAAIFMGTAVASAFVGARAFAESFSRVPKAVYGMSAVLGVLVLASVATYFVLG